MKHIVNLTLFAVALTSTNALAQSCRHKSGQGYDDSVSRYRRYQVSYNDDDRYGERPTGDRRYSTERPDSWANDYRTGDGRMDNHRMDNYRTDRSRNDDYSDSRYDRRLTNDRVRSGNCEDGHCDTSGCEDGRCGLDGKAGDCRDGNCSIDSRVGSNRDRRFRPTSDRFGSFNDAIGFPQRRQANYGPRVNGINWTTGLQQAADLAARENLPMLIQVTADWCSHCQQMKREAYTHASVIDVLNRNYITVQIDADRDKAFVEQMGITSLPTTLIVAPNRQILERAEGARSAEDLLRLLQQNQSAEAPEEVNVTTVR